MLMAATALLEEIPNPTEQESEKTLKGTYADAQVTK